MCVCRVGCVLLSSMYRVACAKYLRCVRRRQLAARISGDWHATGPPRVDARTRSQNTAVCYACNALHIYARIRILMATVRILKCRARVCAVLRPCAKPMSCASSTSTQRHRVHASVRACARHSLQLRNSRATRVHAYMKNCRTSSAEQFRPGTSSCLL